MGSMWSTTKVEFVGKAQLEDGVTAFTFRAAKPLKHIAGQHGFFAIKGAGMKPFSIASAPSDDHVLIATKLASGSRFKTALAALTPGEHISVRGPIMKFTFDNSADEVVFIAQGVGITPFRSLLRHHAASKLGKHTTLIHVAREHVFRAETEALAKQAFYPDDAESFRLHVKEATTERPWATYYVSGAMGFIKETVSLLVEQGIPAKHIKKDQFRGY